jgi:hypothetical protein
MQDIHNSARTARQAKCGNDETHCYHRDWASIIDPREILRDPKRIAFTGACLLLLFTLTLSGTTLGQQRGSLDVSKVGES